MSFRTEGYRNSPNLPALNPLNAELNPICHLLTLLGAHHIFHVSRISVNFQPAATLEPHGLCGNQRYRRELLTMGIMVPETCSAQHKHNKVTRAAKFYVKTQTSQSHCAYIIKSQNKIYDSCPKNMQFVRVATLN